MSSQDFTVCGDYLILNELGYGYQSKVKLGQNIDGRKAALKIFRTDGISLKNFYNEVGVMSQLSHPNIVNMLDYNEKMKYTKKQGKNHTKTCIVLELAQSGDLCNYLCYPKKPFPERICRYYFQQLINGLGYIHDKGIAHRDLKLENLLLDSEFNLKIADLGLSASFQKYEDGQFRTKVGTSDYMAPELQKRQNYDGRRVDIFATGVILIILLMGSRPFKQANASDPDYSLLMNKNSKYFWEIQEKRAKQPDKIFSQELRILLGGMLHPDPQKRFTIEKIQQSSWFQKDSCQNDELLLDMQQRKIIVDQELQLIRVKSLYKKQNIPQ